MSRLAVSLPGSKVVCVMSPDKLSKSAVLIAVLIVADKRSEAVVVCFLFKQ